MGDPIRPSPRIPLPVIRYPTYQIASGKRFFQWVEAEANIPIRPHQGILHNQRAMRIRCSRTDYGSAGIPVAPQLLNLRRITERVGNRPPERQPGILRVSDVNQSDDTQNVNEGAPFSRDVAPGPAQVDKTGIPRSSRTAFSAWITNADTAIAK